MKTNIRDENVESVRARLLERSEVGLRKYGVTTQRTDWNRIDRLRHAQEEALDLAVYLEAEIQSELKQAPIHHTGCSPSEAKEAVREDIEYRALVNP